MSAEPVLGTYRAVVANNKDPLGQTRVTLFIPQVLGNAESAWAVPSSPTNRVPDIGQVVWVTFAGGDVTKPVYAPLGLLEIDASQISAGAIKSIHLDAEAINGKTITGSLIQTAATGKRIVIFPGDVNDPDDSSQVVFYSGSPNESSPGELWSYVADAGIATLPQIMLTAPQAGPYDAAFLRLMSPIEDETPGRFELSASHGYGYGWSYIKGEAAGTDFQESFVEIFTQNAPNSPSGVMSTAFQVWGDKARFNIGTSRHVLDASGLTVDGKLKAANIAFGAVSISTAAPNTPASVTVTIPPLKGSSFRAYVTANSSVPGTGMLGVSATDVSSTGLTIWITRNNVQSTTVWWLLLGT